MYFLLTLQNLKLTFFQTNRHAKRFVVWSIKIVINLKFVFNDLKKKWVQIKKEKVLLEEACAHKKSFRTYIDHHGLREQLINTECPVCLEQFLL